MHKRHFNHQYATIGSKVVPIGANDRYYAQDLGRDNRYLEGLAGRMMLDSFGVTSALLYGGIVTKGTGYNQINITAAKGLCQFDVTVTDDDQTWAIPAVSKTDQIVQTARSDAQTDFSITTGTLDGVTTNYVKLRYKEVTAQTRTRTNAAGNYAYSVQESYQIVVDAVAPTAYDVLLASFVGNGTSTLMITQRYPIGPAGYLMTQCAILGMTYDGTDAFLSERVQIATAQEVGESIISSISLTPTAISASRTSANPTAAKYAPYIPRHDADHDISTSQVPQWVIDKLNAEKVTFNGISAFTGTNAAGVISFVGSTELDHLLDWITEQSLVNRWYDSNEAANYGSLGGLFTGTAQLALTIANVNYAITGCSKGLRTITLGTYPANGTVSVALYPGRIAGSTTSSRLRRISGEAIVAAGDVTGEVVVGGRRMGKILGHSHYINVPTTGSGGVGNPTPGSLTGNLVQATNAAATTLFPDGTNTLVTGKSNDPRTAGMAVYTHLAVVNATNWT